MRNNVLIAAIAAFLGATGAANASTKTFFVEITNLRDFGFLEAAGISEPVERIGGAVTFDWDDPGNPTDSFAEPSWQRSPRDDAKGDVDVARYNYMSFRLDIGSQSVIGNDSVGDDRNDYILITDGIADGTSRNVRDEFRVTSKGSQNLAMVSNMFIRTWDFDESFWSGLTIPDAATLNEMGDAAMRFKITGTNAADETVWLQGYDLEFTEVITTPLPAGMPLMLSGVLVLGALRHRRRRNG